MNSKRRYWVHAGAALAAGLLLRLWIVSLLARVDGDSLIYGGIAKNLLQHRLYGFAETDASGLLQFRPTLIRLPGYPLFLAGCFKLFGIEHYRAVMNVQVFADLLTCWLTSRLTNRLFGRRSALAVLWLAALCPFPACYVALPLTETLVLTTIALTFYAFARWMDAGVIYNRWLWTMGAAVSCSVLLRPEQGLLAAAIIPTIVWHSWRTSPDRTLFSRPALVVALCVVLPLIPWTARNWSTFHVIQPLAPRYANDPGEMPPLGFSRWYRTWAIDFASTEDIYWNLNGDRIEVADLPIRAFAADSTAASNSLRARTTALIADYNVTTTLTPTLDQRFANLAQERLQAHPVLCHLGLPLARLLDMTLRPRVEMMNIPMEWWRWDEHPAPTAFAGFLAVLNLAYLILGFAGFWRWRRTQWRSTSALRTCFQPLALAMLATIVLRAGLLLTMDNSETRYTLEFFPVLFVWTGAMFADRLLNTASLSSDR